MAAAGIFTFLNDTRPLGDPIDWRAEHASQLWRYHLHYFDYLPDLVLAGAAEDGLSLMGDWMTRVPLAHPMIRGLINLRGQIVTAIDLRCRRSSVTKWIPRPLMSYTMLHFVKSPCPTLFKMSNE